MKSPNRDYVPVSVEFQAEKKRSRNNSTRTVLKEFIIQALGETEAGRLPMRLRLSRVYIVSFRPAGAT